MELYQHADDHRLAEVHRGQRGLCPAEQRRRTPALPAHESPQRRRRLRSLADGVFELGLRNSAPLSVRERQVDTAAANEVGA